LVIAGFYVNIKLSDCFLPVWVSNGTPYILAHRVSLQIAMTNCSANPYTCTMHMQYTKHTTGCPLFYNTDFHHFYTNKCKKNCSLYTS